MQRTGSWWFYSPRNILKLVAPSGVIWSTQVPWYWEGYTHHWDRSQNEPRTGSCSLGRHTYDALVPSLQETSAQPQLEMPLSANTVPLFQPHFWCFYQEGILPFRSWVSQELSEDWSPQTIPKSKGSQESRTALPVCRTSLRYITVHAQQPTPARISGSSPTMGEDQLCLALHTIFFLIAIGLLHKEK